MSQQCRCHFEILGCRTWCHNLPSIGVSSRLFDDCYSLLGPFLTFNITKTLWRHLAEKLHKMSLLFRDTFSARAPFIYPRNFSTKINQFSKSNRNNADNNNAQVQIQISESQKQADPLQTLFPRMKSLNHNQKHREQRKYWLLVAHEVVRWKGQLRQK